MTRRMRTKKRCEIYLFVPEEVSAVNKNLLDYVKKLFSLYNIKVLVVCDSSKFEAPADKNICCVYADLTEKQCGILRNRADVVEILIKK